MKRILTVLVAAAMACASPPRYETRVSSQTWPLGPLPDYSREPMPACAYNRYRCDDDDIQLVLRATRWRQAEALIKEHQPIVYGRPVRPEMLMDRDYFCATQPRRARTLQDRSHRRACRLAELAAEQGYADAYRRGIPKTRMKHSNDRGTVRTTRVRDTVRIDRVVKDTVYVDRIRTRTVPQVITRYESAEHPVPENTIFLRIGEDYYILPDAEYVCMQTDRRVCLSRKDIIENAHKRQGL